MSVFELFRSFTRTFARQRIRALLTLLGIVIGTGSVVMLTGLLKSAEEAMLRLSQSVNETDTIRFVTDEPPSDQRDRTTRPLSRRDGSAVEQLAMLDGVQMTPESRLITQARFEGREKRVRLMGVDQRALDMYRLELLKGRFIDEQDLAGGRRVAVVGYEVYTELFKKSKNTLGAQLHVDKESWTIVGVLAHKPYSGHGTGTWMWDRRVIAPRTAFDASYSPAHKVHSIFLKLPQDRSSSAFVKAAGILAESLILRLHLGVKNFKLDERQGAKQERSIIAVIQILLVATVMMSLLVGGINIMNIMLVTVTERTREIGIRRAVGASQRAIMLQFLFESAAVSSVGGLLGISGGIVMNWLVGLGLASMFGRWTFHLEPWAIAMSMGLAVTTGVVFGLFPAMRAARLDPVEALRSE